MIILIFVFLIYPTFSEIKKSSQDFLSQKEKLTSLETKAENLEKFQTYYQEIKSNLEKIDKLFVNPEVPVDFISFLEETSRDSDVAIKIAPGSLAKTAPWSSLFFQIATVSSFPNFLKFLEKLESSIYLIEIQNLNIARLSEDDVSANISLKVYTQ